MKVTGAKKPSFLVAAATHPNATTEKADVVLPLSTWVESHGVFVSTEGTVQFSRQSILPVGDSKPAWEIAKLLIGLLEKEDLEVKSPKVVYSELGALNSNFSGADYSDFQAPGEVHWSYPQQAGLGMPRPDLSAIPVSEPDSPMWMPTVATGSKVEMAGRLHRGQQPPAAPGQTDPRRIAALLGLTLPVEEGNPSPASALPAKGVPKKEGYLPLRVISNTAAEPPGPTPASRHHEIGVGRRRQVQVPVAKTALLEEAEAEPETLDHASSSEEKS